MKTQLTLKIMEEEINLKQNQCIVVRLLNLYYKFLLKYCKGGILLHNRGVRGLFKILILRVIISGFDITFLTSIFQLECQIKY